MRIRLSLRHSLFAAALVLGTAASISALQAMADQGDPPGAREVIEGLVVAQADAVANGDYTWWRQERAMRLAALQDYLDENHAEFESFRTAPLAIKQGLRDPVGFQMIVFRLLPEVFPDIMGPPEDKLAIVGLGPDPFDPESVLPLGIGYARSEPFSIPSPGNPAVALAEDISINYAVPSCMACHSGGVVDDDGTLIRMVGAPNPLGDLSGAINRAVNDPRYTVEDFRTVLNGKPVGWVYGFDPDLMEQEVLERALFDTPVGAFFLQEIKLASNGVQERIDNTLGVYTYNIPNPPLLRGMPGSLDVFGFGAAAQANPDLLSPSELEAALPAAPAPSDMPATWRQDQRPQFQWDNSITNLTFRIVAASASVSGGNPAAVNMDNVVATSAFTLNLPAHPYPFDVDGPAADRGALIFQQACAGCHAPGNDVVASPEAIGTDPNRAEVFTDVFVERLIENLRAACTAPECFDENGRPLPDSEVLQPTGGYAQIPLVGVWGTAPYLHNGSVPTLYHLLTGDRPDTFFRGNFTYDQELVGFTWDNADRAGAVLYDTNLAGYSNAGHSTPAFSGGIDWQAEPGKLRDLLEYLKTM